MQNDLLYQYLSKMVAFCKKLGSRFSDNILFGVTARLFGDVVSVICTNQEATPLFFWNGLLFLICIVRIFSLVLICMWYPKNNAGSRLRHRMLVLLDFSWLSVRWSSVSRKLVHSLLNSCSCSSVYPLNATTKSSAYLVPPWPPTIFL
jgi:hypothetical protein